MTKQLMATLAISICLASTAAAQESQYVQYALERETRPGDRLTVDMHDRGRIEGRLIRAGVDILTIETVAGPASIPYSSIDRVRRRRNGVLLGSIIGLGVGVSLGIPAKMLADNETGDGTQALVTIAAIGLGAGLALDAALSVNHTVFRRYDTNVRFEVAPTPRGVAAGVRVEW